MKGFISLDKLQSFERRATVREVLAAQMEVSKNNVEDIINSNGGWNWMSSIARKCYPVRSTSYIKNCLLSNLDNTAQFKVTASVDGYAYSFLVFNDEGFEIELLWNCMDEYMPAYENKLEKRVAKLEKLLGICNKTCKYEDMNQDLTHIAKELENLLNVKRTSAFEIKAYDDDITVSFDWDYDYGYFTITIRDGVYFVEDEYYVEEFNNIEQVADYLVKKDNDNGR